MKVKVGVMSKEDCLKIAKIVHKDSRTNEDFLLDFLPDNVFGRYNRVVSGSNINGTAHIEVYDNEKEGFTWDVPIYFIRSVTYIDEEV